MTPQDNEEYTRNSFESYCKKILKYAARDYYRTMRRQMERETPFSELTARELATLAAADEYFKDEHAFDVLGATVSVSDFELAEALNTLPADRRDIVLMSYFFDMTDKEIAEKLNMARRTVAHHRASTLKQLKNLLESED